jgi:exonuclease V gamma subunit
MPQLSELSGDVSELLASAENIGVRRPAPHAHPIDLRLSEDTHMVGSVGNCLDGDRPGPVRILYSRPKPKHQIRLALDLLVLTATDPTQHWRGVLITRPESDAKTTVEQRSWSVRGATAKDRQVEALDALGELLEQYQDGLRYPLPLFQQTSYAFFKKLKPKDVWGTPGDPYSKFPKECDDPYHSLAFGSLSYNELFAAQFGEFNFTTESNRLWSVIEDALTVENLETAEEPSEEDGGEDE